MNDIERRPNTPDEMIEIVTAFRDGKQLQLRGANVYDSDEWSPWDIRLFDFIQYQFRIKPKRRIICIRRGSDFKENPDIWETEEGVEIDPKTWDTYINVREVTEEGEAE